MVSCMQSRILRNKLLRLRSDSGRYLQRAMVVAVPAMRVMKMPADDVIEVISVRRSLMAALGSVGVLMVVSSAIVAGRAVVWVGAAN